METRIGMFGAALVLAAGTAMAQYATDVINYNHGTGFATEFGSGAGYTNSAAAIGEPSKVTPGDFGGPVDPFSPPYTRDQVVSIGTGGSLTVKFTSPIVHDASHPYGLDFTIFGDTGFSIVNGDFGGGGVTDGSLFNPRGAVTTVSVSADGANFFKLNPSLAPVIGDYYPTDGSGNFGLPLNPALKPGDFAGANMAKIRSLYAGSAGGASYSLAWAIDGAGSTVAIDAVNFIRIDVLSGAAQVDGISAVVPEPGVVALAGLGLVGVFVFGRRK
ncbi:MAG TPA: PEP-CTERM sorting domain-containing protein [Candidatus Limnocylindria bacterium]|nr:PEP-CTERM sorting domain-containing protein [Candidatus Limnocylindria bacterium]